MRSWSLALGFAAALLALPALAQAPQGTRTRVRGTVEKLDGQTLVVKSRDGQPVTIALDPNYSVRAVVKKSLSDIHDGDFVASTSVRHPDGKLYAVEVHIFLPSQKGVVPEFQGPWDLLPNSVMTNAIVTGKVSGTQGETLKVKYKDTETEVVVPPNCPIVSYAPGDASLLKPGAAVFIIALKKPDGTLSANSVTAEKDGVKPPM